MRAGTWLVLCLAFAHGASTPLASQSSEDRARIDYEAARLAIENEQYVFALEKLEAVANVLGRSPQLLSLIAEAALGADQVDKAAAAAKEAFDSADQGFRQTSSYARLVEVMAKIELRKAGVATQESSVAAQRELQRMGLSYTQDGLYKAVGEDNRAAVAAYLRAGMSPDFLVEETSRLEEYIRGEPHQMVTTEKISPLILACRKGHRELVRLLLESGANIAFKGTFKVGFYGKFESNPGESPLKEVVPFIEFLEKFDSTKGDLSLYTVFINRGVRPSYIIFGERPSIAFLESLLRDGAKLNQFELHRLVISFSWPEGMKFLLARGSDANQRDSGGRTVLHTAAGACKPEYIRLLIESGADPKALDRYKKTPHDNAKQKMKFSDDPKIRTACQETIRLLDAAGKRPRG